MIITAMLRFPVFMFLCGCCFVAGIASQEESPARKHRLLARHYAPAIYQETRSGQLDFLARFDFDGDLNGANNWDHAYLFDLRAYVYYAVIESTRHYFITYAFFHPRDYTSQPFEGFAPKMEHENDLEGFTLLIEKDGSPRGRPILIETLAHDHFYLYGNADVSGIVPRARSLDGSIVFLEKGSEGRHRTPAIYIEAEGHGVLMASEEVVRDDYEHPGVVYRFSRGEAEVPENARDQNVSYQLLPLHSTLWKERFDVGPESVYCCGSPYEMFNGEEVVLGESFNGPIGGCAARPPWGWDQRDDGPIERGDWFRDPLRSYAYQLDIRNFGGEYLHNPYLRSRASPRRVDLCTESGDSRTVKESVTESLLGIASILLSGEGSAKDRASRLFLSDGVLLEWQGRDSFSLWRGKDFVTSLDSSLFVEEDAVAYLRFESPKAAGISSPALNAPAQYFNRLILRYRSPGQPAEIRIRGRFRDGEEFTSEPRSLPASTEWTRTALSLTEMSGWSSDKRIERILLEFTGRETASLARRFTVFSGTDEEESAPLEISLIVLDRRAFADTFVR